MSSKRLDNVKTELRIVAGTLRGRRITVRVHPGLRPTPQRVRESLFSILGNAVPDRVFYDVFSGTGLCGLEAVSRGARESRLIEADAKSCAEIEKYAKAWDVADQIQVMKADVYRWADRWMPPQDAVTMFLSPPFPDLEEARIEQFLKLVETLRAKMPAGSVMALQIEDGFPMDRFEDLKDWDVRKYGRNVLMFWVKPLAD